MKTHGNKNNNPPNLNFQLLGGEALAHAEDSFVQGMIPIETRGFSFDERATFPVLSLDLSDRPDVRDLYRVAEQEGERASLMSKWSAICGPDAKARVRLDIVHRRPARCQQRIVFNLPEDLELLMRIAMDGRVGIVSATHAGDQLVLIVGGGHRELAGVLHCYAIAALTAWGELRP